MRLIITVSLSIIYLCAYSQKFNEKTNNLNECFVLLDKILDDTVKFNYKMLPVDESVVHAETLDFGRWIRNNWGLWDDSQLRRSLSEKGLPNPDAMSWYILREYCFYLKAKDGKPKYDTLPLSNLYNVNDTVAFTISITQKRFLRKVIVVRRALGIIQGYGDYHHLRVKLIKIPLNENESAEFKENETISFPKIFFELIPPRS